MIVRCVQFVYSSNVNTTYQTVPLPHRSFICSTHYISDLSINRWHRLSWTNEFSGSQNTKKKSASIGSVMSEELKDITFSIKQNYLSAVMQGEIERYRTVHICSMVSYGLQRLEALAIVWNTYMQPGRCLSDKSQTVRSWLKGIFGTWILWNSIKLSLALIYIITWPLSYKTIGRGEFPLDYSSKTCDFYINYIFSDFISIKTLRTKNIFDEQLIVRSKRTCVNVGGWIWTFFLKHHLIWCFPAQISSN
jgi:hypothetical protein